MRVPVNLFSLADADDMRAHLRAAARVVVSDIGMMPNIEAASAKCLAEEGGIPVDNLSSTADLDILVASHCTLQHHVLNGRQLRLKFIPTR